MNFDLRFPLGLMFALFGAMLVTYGAITDSALYKKSLGLNINLGWGLALLVFGGVMLLLAWKDARK